MSYFKECFENIQKRKIISHNTINKLKDIEIDKEILIHEICKGLNEKSIS